MTVEYYAYPPAPEGIVFRFHERALARGYRHADGNRDIIARHGWVYRTLPPAEYDTYRERTRRAASGEPTLPALGHVASAVSIATGELIRVTLWEIEYA